MTESIQQCCRCGLRGYYLTDKKRGLCHLCVERERCRKEILEDLYSIRDNFMKSYRTEKWDGCEFAKAFIGNAILEAIKETEEK
jgi:hypothetical protein